MYRAEGYREIPAFNEQPVRAPLVREDASRRLAAHGSQAGRRAPARRTPPRAPSPPRRSGRRRRSPARRCTPWRSASTANSEASIPRAVIARRGERESVRQQHGRRAMGSGRRDEDVDRDVLLERREPLARRGGERRARHVPPRRSRGRASSARTRAASPGRRGPAPIVVRGHGPGSSCSVTVRRDTVGERADRPRRASRVTRSSRSRGRPRRAASPASPSARARAYATSRSRPARTRPDRRLLALAERHGVTPRAAATLVARGTRGTARIDLGRAGEPLDRLLRRQLASERVEVVAQPVGERQQVAGGELVVEVGERLADDVPDLERDDVAERVGREVADPAARPVDVLQDAVARRRARRRRGTPSSARSTPRAGPRGRPFPRAAPARARSGG